MHHEETRVRLPNKLYTSIRECIIRATYRRDENQVSCGNNTAISMRYEMV